MRTDVDLSRALRSWLDAEEQDKSRVDAVRVAAAVAALAAEVLDQRVLEARSFRATWAEIAEAVGITRQSAHRRWRHLDPLAETLRAERERRFRPTRPPKPARPPVHPDDWDSWRPDWPT